MKKFTILLMLALAMFAVACGGAAPEPTEEPEPTEVVEPTAEMEVPTIAGIAAADDNFSTLVAALDAAGLVGTLDSEGEYTVFAPTNDAFAALPEGTVDALLAEPEGALTEILLYHVVDGIAMAGDVVGLESVTTLQGEEIAITVEDGNVFLNETVMVTATDIEASNGVIHVIDAVIMPPSMSADSMPSIAEIAAGDENFGTLVAALDAAGLVQTLSDEGEFTVFAPTDDAFAALPEGLLDTLLEDPGGDLTQILLYHVVEGVAFAEDVVGLEAVTTLQGSDITITVTDDGVFLNETIQVVTTDIEASNGVIHVIDGVLVPESGSMDDEMMEIDPESIAGIAAADENFSTLVAALDAAGLVGTLADEGEFTVFAPTNDAFAALPEGTVDALLEDPEGDLTQILLYHVVSGVALAEDVVGLEAVTTLQGSDVTITVNDDGVFLNDTIQVVTTDIEASNGVIHVIDGVLLPPAEGEAMDEELLTIAEVATEAGTFNTLLAALDAAGLAEAFADPEFGPVTVFAPTDDAFDALPDGTLDSLLADPEGALTDVLRYHVVPGIVLAEDVVMLDSATTDLGQDVTITVTDDGVFLNDTIQIVTTDIMASNGVIHVIDAVLVPAE